MTGKAYTVADEQKNLERFLKKEKIEFNSNYYLRMEKGPKPIYYKMISFAAQIRFSVVEFYYLVFTENSLILLEKDENDRFNKDCITSIDYKDIHHFSYQKKSGVNAYYGIYFQYFNEDYYFYLSDHMTSRLLDKIFNLRNKNSSYKNLFSLEKINFRGLLKK